MPVSQLIAAVPGAAWQPLHALTDQGLLPTFSRLIDHGALGTLTAAIPNAAIPLWTSVATGQPTHIHGLLDGVMVHGDGDTRRIVHASAAQRRVPAFWELTARAGRSTLVVGWPGTHQATAHLTQQEPCALVSDLFAWPGLARRDALLEGAIHPREQIEPLRDARLDPEEIDAETIAFFVPDWQQVDQDQDPSLAGIAGAVAESLSHQAAFTALLTERHWDLAVVCWPLVARLAPAFTGATAPFNQVLERAYRLLDQLLGQCLEQACPERTWLLSANTDKPTPTQRPHKPADELRVVRYKGEGFVIAAGTGILEDTLITKASVLDLMPTWLAAAGCPVPAHLPGRAMMGLFRDGLGQIPGDPVSPAMPDTDAQPEPVRSADQRFLALVDAGTPDTSLDIQRIERVANQCRWNQALSLLDDDRPRQALPLLEDLHASLPEQPSPAAQLAETRLTLRDIRGAREAAEAMLDLAPDATPTLLLMARIERETGNHDAALALLQRAEANGADSVVLHRQIAYTQLYLRRWRDAADRYDQALAQSPEDLGSHLGKTRALLALRRFAEALDSARRALGLDPDLALARFYLGIALVRLGRPEDGLAELKTAATLAPWSHGAHAWVVRLLKHLKRPTEEISLHLQAMHDIRFRRERRAAEVRQSAATSAAGHGAASGASTEVVLDGFDDAPFDWGAIDAIPEEPPRPLDLVLVSSLPGGGDQTVTDRLATAGLRVAQVPGETIEQLGDALAGFPAGEDEIARIAPHLLAKLPRLHHYQVLFVLQPAERVAEALAATAAHHGLPPDEVSRLARRFQRAVVRLLSVAPHIDPLILTPEDLARTDAALVVKVREHIGEHRVATRLLNASP